jgi:TonB family protein
MLLIGATAVLLTARPRKTRAVRAGVADVPATVTAEIGDLLREPAPRSAPAGSLPKGARVTIVAERGRWLEVRAGNGERGFLAAESVETDAERRTREERGKQILAFTPVAGVVAEETDILLAPFPSAPRAGYLRRGTAIPIYAVDHDFYAMRAGDGGIGFVRSSDVDLVPPDPRRPVIVPDAGKSIKDVTVTDLAPATPSPSSAPGAQPAATNWEGEAPAPEEPLEPALLVSKEDPEYPVAARRAGVEGTVILDATIDETGQVTQVAVERGLPLGISEAAVAAVRHWKYKPARGRAGPVASHKAIRIVFSLRE